MKRSIVQHGSSSLTITLPIKWTERFSLKKGDDLEVEESGPQLIISTPRSQAITKKEVSTTEYGVFTKNNLSHLYQLGYDEIEIKFDDASTLDEIKRRITNCIGFEIIDQKKDRVFIKSIATTLDTEFDTLLRKSFLITKEMAEGIVQALERGEPEELQGLRHMEALNNKFTDVCLRILSKRGYKVPHRTMQMYDIIKTLERICDELKYICDLQPKKIDKVHLALLREATEYFTTFYVLFYKFDPKLKKQLYELRKTLLARIDEKMQNSPSPLLLHHIRNFVEKTYDGAGGYFALIL